MDAKNALKGCALFRNMDPVELLKITEVARRRFLEKGETVIAEGDEFDTDASLYVVVSGLAKVCVPVHGLDTRELVLSILAPNDHFGEMSFMDERPRSASVVAMEDTELLRIERPAMENLLAEEGEIALKFYRNLARALVSKLRQTNVTLSDGHIPLP
jgi:CRP/FNR family cyclic AMP-dependent transcriptional regulator